MTEDDEGFEDVPSIPRSLLRPPLTCDERAGSRWIGSFSMVHTMFRTKI